MPDQKSERLLTHIINNNQLNDLNTKVELLEEELKYKEVLLINLEKLSSLGQFVREIVHELKNPLTAISGFTELGKLAKTKKDREEYLNKIPRFINQITSRLSQFRAMTFNSGINYTKLDLIQTLAECLSTLELLKPKSSTIDSNFVSMDCKIFGDSEQWIQVFLGVCRFYFTFMKEIKSTLKVKMETFSANDLKGNAKDIDVSIISHDEWTKRIEKNNSWIKITFENKKISIPNSTIVELLSQKNFVDNLDKIQELGIVIASDIVRRHQGNIYTKKIKSSGFSLHICVPKID